MMKQISKVARIGAIALALLMAVPAIPFIAQEGKAETEYYYRFSDATSSGVSWMARERGMTPLLTNGDSYVRYWSTDGDNQTGSDFGYAVVSAGDVNNDGYGDVLIGAPSTDTDKTSAGKVYLYYGSPKGVTTRIDWMRIEEFWSSSGDNQANTEFGSSVAGVGDVNADGFDDILIGASGYDTANANAGKAYLYLGASGGSLGTSPAWTSSGDNQAQAAFGYSVAGAGDVNSDGFADVIIGSYSYDSPGANAGKAYVFLGCATGLQPYNVWNSTGDNKTGAYFGLSVAGAGDVNGDGYDDVIVGAPYYDTDQDEAGRAFIYTGDMEGIASQLINFSGTNQSNAHFGFSVDGAGDVNADGYDDVIIGSPTYDAGLTLDVGRAHLYTGGPTSAWISEGWNTSLCGVEQADAKMGFSVAGAGDADDDRFSDFVVGSPYHDGDYTNSGRVDLYSGYNNTTLIRWSYSTVGENFISNAYFGYSVDIAGDVDGDGRDDLLVGSENFRTYGKAYVYYSRQWYSSGCDQNSAWFGKSVSGAGDVNGDGYDEILVGAPGEDNTAGANSGMAYLYYGTPSGPSRFPGWNSTGSNKVNSSFGYSVSRAGDVNNDGYDDVIIGASDDDTAASNAGRAFLYLGSASGLSTTAAWTSAGDRQAGSIFGYNVADAGDVNDDGYDDVIIGACTFDTANSNAGKAYLFLGCATGLQPVNAWNSSGDDVASAYFSDPVAGVGDVNGDGHDDVLVGAYPFDLPSSNCGKVWLFYGNDTGLTAQVWNATGPGSSYFGRGCDGADVNGDGYSDVFIGANAYSVSNGLVHGFYGSATGLGSEPDWNSSGIRQGSSYFGYSVAAAGDVNGDGFADLLIGSPTSNEGLDDEGRAEIFLGSPSGPRASSDAHYIGAGQPLCYFGASVAGAGDVDGDGYDDMLVGAYQYDTSYLSAGQASVYRGGPLDSGIVETRAFDSGAMDTRWEHLLFGYLAQPPGTRVSLQIASSNSGAGWRFRGPDGSEDSYYTINDNGALWMNQTGRYMKFRVYFHTDRIPESPSVGEVTITYSKPSPPTVTVTSPNGGEDWMKARGYPITWTAEGVFNATPVSLYYSTNSGNTWTLIAANEKNDGVYNWTVPTVNTADAMIKVEVTDIDGETAYDMSDMSFAIDPPPPVRFQLNSPAEGTVWGAGNHRIEWTLVDDEQRKLVSRIGMELSRDGGVTWATISDDAANTGSLDWTVPEGTGSSKECVLRLGARDGDGLPITVESGRFTIDTILPTVAHVPPATARTGAPVQLELSASDDAGTVSSVLWYRMSGEDFRAVQMHPAGASRFVSELPARPDEGTLYYYFEVSDGTNRKTTDVYSVAVIRPGKGAVPGPASAPSWSWLLLGVLIGGVVALGISAVALQKTPARGPRVRKLRVERTRHKLNKRAIRRMQVR